MAVRKWNFDLSRLEEHMDFVASLFDVPTLYETKKEALRSLFAGKNLYVSASTGSGKSLIFQCIAPLLDLLQDNHIGHSTVLVISPLKSLMFDQVAYLQQKSAVSAASIYDGQSEKVLDDNENGPLYTHHQRVCWLAAVGEMFFRRKASGNVVK